MIKKYFPVLIAVFFGLFFVLQAFIGYFDRYAEILRNWVIIISVFALMLGVFNLMHRNFMRIKKDKGAEKLYSVVVILSFLFTVSAGFLNWGKVFSSSSGYFSGKPDLVKKIVSEAISGDAYFSFYPAKEKLTLLISKDIVPYYIPDEKELRRADFTLKQYLSFFDDESKLEPSLMSDSVFSKDASAIKDLSNRIAAFSGKLAFSVVNGKNVELYSVYGFKKETEIAVKKIIEEDSSIRKTDGKETLSWIFEVFYKPLSSSFFALLAFSVIAVVFKSFKLKNIFATIFVISATIVLLGHISFGKILADTVEIKELQFSSLLDWLLFVPNMAAQRAILISTGLGICFYSLKLLFGIERPYDGEDDAK